MTSICSGWTRAIVSLSPGRPRAGTCGGSRPTTSFQEMPKFHSAHGHTSRSLEPALRSASISTAIWMRHLARRQTPTHSKNGINTLRIGGQNRGGVTRVLNGTIDEVRMYNQALTPAQIQSDMNAPIGTLSIPPSIATQPANQTVTAGQTAMFTVVAAGVAPLGYQWQKNGVNIAGATAASYATPATSSSPATTTSDNGATFRVVVSNPGGTVTSSAATLTVNSAPAPAIQVSPTSVH